MAFTFGRTVSSPGSRLLSWWTKTALRSLGALWEGTLAKKRMPEDAA